MSQSVSFPKKCGFSLEFFYNRSDPPTPEGEIPWSAQALLSGRFGLIRKFLGLYNLFFIGPQCLEDFLNIYKKSLKKGPCHITLTKESKV